MEKDTAHKFAEHWIAAWNAHDLDAILSHYAEKLEYYTPMAKTLKFSDTGVITQKSELRKYFEIGLKAYPDLHFQFHKLFIGINSIVVYYTSVKGKLVTEVFELNEEGKAIRVYCNYAEGT